LDVEETTIESARSPFESKIISDDNEELLELAVPAEERPAVAAASYDYTESDEEVLSLFDDEVAKTPISENVAPVVLDSGVTQTAQDDTFSMFGDSKSYRHTTEQTGLLGKIAVAAGLILIGGILGIGAYRLFLAPSITNSGIPPISEMKTANIPLSAFEENRRNVDKDPVGYVAKFGAAPEDSEDFYLLGRAYLLTGDYPKARTALTEARNRLADADPVNARILASDIAMALAVTNDTTIQSMLKKELDAAAKPLANANSNR
jgi:cytochrome c-type biogenesis protein CcmH/NrfG